MDDKWTQKRLLPINRFVRLNFKYIMLEADHVGRSDVCEHSKIHRTN